MTCHGPNTGVVTSLQQVSRVHAACVPTLASPCTTLRLRQRHPPSQQLTETGADTMRDRPTAASTKFELLAQELERQIAAGVLRPGDRLPSLRQACASRGLSPSTVSQA
jgi:hypothetical protein